MLRVCVCTRMWLSSGLIWYPSIDSSRIFPFTLFTSKSTAVCSPVRKLYCTICFRSLLSWL